MTDNERERVLATRLADEDLRHARIQLGLAGTDLQEAVRRFEAARERVGELSPARAIVPGESADYGGHAFGVAAYVDGKWVGIAACETVSEAVDMMRSAEAGGGIVHIEFQGYVL